MILFKNSVTLKNWLFDQRKKVRKIGFVPTMGALHQGHISLIEASKKMNELTVCSIFVNPTQFNDPKDFDKYPITIENDIQLLETAFCDILFIPSVKEMYPNGLLAPKKYELGNLESVLEGQFRKGHYQGVCMIVERLLQIVMPDNLYLGQKDFQQCMVISKLIGQLGLQEKIAVNICPTLREYDGLAMSSRNMRLSEKERLLAPEIYKALLYIKANMAEKKPSELKNISIKLLEDVGFKVDYVEIADSTTLLPISEWDESKKAVVLVAAYNNEIRLIDNLLLY